MGVIVVYSGVGVASGAESQPKSQYPLEQPECQFPLEQSESQFPLAQPDPSQESYGEPDVRRDDESL